MSSKLSRRQFLSRSAAIGVGTSVAASSLTDNAVATTQETSLKTLVDEAADRALTKYDAGGLSVAVVDGDDVLTSGPASRRAISYNGSFHVRCL